jgi:hypothetical protein
MTNNFSFIVSTVRYSYSTLSGYEQCPHSFRLSKIDAVPQIQNFYGDFGSFVHLCFEKFFKGELEAWELSGFYKDNYSAHVVSDPPQYPKDMAGKYFDQGLLYFDYFGFEKDAYDILFVEETLTFQFEGSEFIIKPDLLLHAKEEPRDIILVDYKTAVPFKPGPKKELDPKKMAGYKKQLYVYGYSVRTQKNITPTRAELWFPRFDRKAITGYNLNDEKLSTDWMTEVINKIRADQTFAPNISNKYFCSNICSVRNSCVYK